MADDQLERLIRAVQDDAAIRRVLRLQPTGGPGDKIFPPTYPGERRNDPPRHVFERRRVGGQDVLCVLVDSVQSQANRLEEALRQARDGEEVSFPVITVDFSDTEVRDIGRVTTLDAPHRVFDAIIRDSQHNGKRFADTDEGKQLIAAKSQNALAVYQLSPTALVFGAWNSTGEGGGLGAKFPRAVVSEIVGVGVAVEPGDRPGEPERPSGQRTGSRVDPLGIRSGVRVYKQPDGEWSLEPSKAKGAKGEAVRPSEINHSNIAPSITPLGVSVDHALHTFVLSCAALRRLRFSAPGRQAAAGDGAARAALAALGLLAALAQDRSGYFLRSRCDLVPETGQSHGFEIVRADGSVESFALNVGQACALVQQAAERAAAGSVRWRGSDLTLKPQEKLVSLVLQSRELALRGAEDAEDAEA